MKHLFLSLCIITFAFSCSESKDSDSTTNTTDTNFFALTVGNSWVYKNYRYNPNTETYDDTGVIDSISIVDMQDISGKSFFRFRRLTTGNEEGITFCNPNGEHFELLRERDGNLVNEEDEIKFTNSNFEERLVSEAPWGSIFEVLVKGNTVLNVEAGEFDCINSERYAKNLQSIQLDGLDLIYYSEGFGLILETLSSATNSTPSIIRRLDTFNIQ